LGVVARESIRCCDIAEGVRDAAGVGEQRAYVEALCSDVCLKLLASSAMKRAGEEEVVAGFRTSAVAKAGGMDASLVQCCM